MRTLAIPTGTAPRLAKGVTHTVTHHNPNNPGLLAQPDQHWRGVGNVHLTPVQPERRRRHRTDRPRFCRAASEWMGK